MWFQKRKIVISISENKSDLKQPIITTKTIKRYHEAVVNAIQILTKFRNINYEWNGSLVCPQNICPLTQCSLVMPYGNTDLGQHWLR